MVVQDAGEYDVAMIRSVADMTVKACKEGEAAAIELAFEFAENQARLEDEEDDFEGGMFLFCCTALLRHAVVNECLFVPPPFTDVLADLVDELREIGWELREDAVPDPELADEALTTQYIDDYEEEERLRRLQLEKERAERASSPESQDGQLTEGALAIPGVRITKLADAAPKAVANADDDAADDDEEDDGGGGGDDVSEPSQPAVSPVPAKPKRKSVSEILSQGRKKGLGRRRRR